MSDLYPSAKNPRLRLLIPLVVAFAFFLEQLDSTIIVTAIPDMARGLGETPLRLNLALTSYILSLAVFIPVSGWVADRFGMRQTFCAAIAIFTLGSVACGSAQNLQMLIAARVLQGFGGAMLSPVGRLILLRSFPRSELLNAMVYVSIPAVVGPTLGPLAGGLITTYWNWRWIFYVNIPFGILGILLAWRFVQDVDTRRAEGFDWPGFVILGFGLALLEFGIENLGRPVLPFALVLGDFAAAAVLLTIYVRYARRHSNAALDLSLLRVRTFRLTITAGCLSRIAIAAVPFMLPLMLQIGYGLSPLQSGTLTFASSIGTLIIRPLTVSLLRALGYSRLLVGNALFGGLVIAGFALFSPATPHAVLFVYIIMFGIVRNMQFNAIQTLTFADIPAPVLSRATSLSSVVQQMSMGLGVSIGATLLGLIAGSQTIISVNDFRIAFLCVAVISAAAAPGFLRLRPTDGQQVSGHIRKQGQGAALDAPGASRESVPGTTPLDLKRQGTHAD